MYVMMYTNSFRIELVVHCVGVVNATHYVHFSCFHLCRLTRTLPLFQEGVGHKDVNLHEFYF